MQPTLLEGDVAVVSLLSFELGAVDRGDVVLFASPEHRRHEPKISLVKRCVGLPGDTISFSDGRIRVNGDSIGRYREGSDGSGTRRSKFWSLFRRVDQCVIPYAGYVLDLDSLSSVAWKAPLRREGYVSEYRNRMVFLSGRPATRYRFQQDYVFVLGDNSQASRDSRQFGFVPVQNLIGELTCLLWSDDPHNGIRWGRIGAGID